MSVLKSGSVKYALLFSLAVFAFSANTATAVDVPVNTGDTEVTSAVGTVLSSSDLKGIMNAERDKVVALKVNEKPLINNVMPKIETVMMPKVKEMILPEKMANLQGKVAQKIAPQF
ncbi:MAG: hypothetical protein D3910_28535 [Candidatus Electrothrix sp. ATG2]|nr:hypothetical protein [Candidatus Electrothrix sp. ATG2]